MQTLLARAANELMAPASWQSELVNVFWLAVRQKVIPESAERESLPLATFDRGIIKAFPRVAMNPRQLTSP